MTGPAYVGTHRHLPDDPRLLAGLAAAGPGVGDGVRVGQLDALDVAPTSGAVLGVDLPQAARAPVLAMLAPRARVRTGSPIHASFTGRSSGCNTGSISSLAR